MSAELQGCPNANRPRQQQLRRNGNGNRLHFRRLPAVVGADADEDNAHILLTRGSSRSPVEFSVPYGDRGTGKQVGELGTDGSASGWHNPPR